MHLVTIGRLDVGNLLPHSLMRSIMARSSVGRVLGPY
jgi:hypothetical protein